MVQAHQRGGHSRIREDSAGTWLSANALVVTWLSACRLTDIRPDATISHRKLVVAPVAKKYVAHRVAHNTCDKEGGAPMGSILGSWLKSPRPGVTNFSCARACYSNCLGALSAQAPGVCPGVSLIFGRRWLKWLGPGLKHFSQGPRGVAPARLRRSPG